jgi:hypothetical protein
LEYARGAGEDQIGRGGGDDDQIDFLGIDPSRLNRAVRSMQSQVAGSFTICGAR